MKDIVEEIYLTTFDGNLADTAVIHGILDDTEYGYPIGAEKIKKWIASQLYKFDAEEKQGNSHFSSMLVPLVQMTEDFISLERMEAVSQALLSKGNEKLSLGEMADLLEEEDTVDSKTVRELITKEVNAKVNKLNGDFKKKLLKDYNTVMQKNSFGGGRGKTHPVEP